MKPRSVFIVGISFLLSACTTSAGKQLQVLEPKISSAENNYAQCVSVLNSSPRNSKLLNVIVAHEQEAKPEELLDRSFINQRLLPVLSQYNSDEFSCFTESLRSIDGVDKSAVEGVVANHANALAEMESIIVQANGDIRVGNYNRAMMQLIMSRGNAANRIVQSEVNALRREDASIRAQRSAAIGQLGQSLQDMDSGLSEPSGSFISQAPSASGSTTCFRKNEAKTSNTTQCVYSCLGETHIVTVASYQACPITVQK